MEITQELYTIRMQLATAIDQLDRLIGDRNRSTSDSTSDRVQAMDRTKAIEWLLKTEAKPMRPVEIWAELQRLGRNDPKMEIQVTTFDLWQRGRIGKRERGSYVADPAIQPA